MSKSLKDMLETEDGTANMVKQCLDIVSNSEEVLIFGASVGGTILYNMLKEKGLDNKIIAYSDNSKTKLNKNFMSDRLIVVPPAELTERCGKNCTVIVASSAYEMIKEQLMSYGYPERNIHFFNFAFMDLEYTDKEFIWDHIDDFERAYARMNDEKSREIFVDLMNYKITKNYSYLVHMQKNVDDESRQYFPEGLFEYKENEVFVDIGAYTGDTLKEFDNVYNGGWKKYLGFEADNYYFTELQNCVDKSEKKDKIKIYNLAAWDSETTLYYNSYPGASSMQKEDTDGKTAVKADKLDKILQNEEVTFIKMDIEGAEYNAITGMKELITQNKPILAICVYHLKDDFYILTDLIDDICPSQYSFYFRQYRYGPVDTVCYAVPKYRLL